MGTHTGTFTAGQDYFAFVIGDDGVARPLATYFVVEGGRYVAQPTARASGQDVIAWVDAQGYKTPHLDAILVGSLTSATATTTATAGTALTGIGAFHGLMVRLSVGGVSGGTTAPTLDVYLDGRFDGTNYDNIGHFTALTTAGTSIAFVTKQQGTSVEVASIGTLAGGGTFRNAGFGDAIRVRYSLTGTTPNADFTVYVNLIG